jgi:ABC-type multidrug transport system ATPase subunit
MLAIMGPSGAGKSTVLHAIAGRIRDSSKLTLYGQRALNGTPLSGRSALPAAFVEQDVLFFPHMTVRETLAFRVELKLGSMLVNRATRDAIVDDLMDELGLTQAADTIVGDAKVRGISGGERKRLSIAVEMISSPNLICLDEPTSGLGASIQKLKFALHGRSTEKTFSLTHTLSLSLPHFFVTNMYSLVLLIRFHRSNLANFNPARTGRFREDSDCCHSPTQPACISKV